MKSYKETIGKNSVEFIKNISKIHKSGYELKIAAPYTSLHLSTNYKEIISQHVDYEKPGAHTGSIIMEDLMENGVKESLLNHSERRVGLEVANQTIQRSSELGFTLYVCCETVDEIEKLCTMGAKHVAYEPKELIGGDISVSTSKPEIIKEGAEICKKHGSILLVGAGVKNGEDVKIAKMLGAGGILVASGVVKAKDPFNALNSLMI